MMIRIFFQLKKLMEFPCFEEANRPVKYISIKSYNLQFNSFVIYGYASWDLVFPKVRFIFKRSYLGSREMDREWWSLRVKDSSASNIFSLVSKIFPITYLNGLSWSWNKDTVLNCFYEQDTLKKLPAAFNCLNL